tara:strand:- start:687 stop:1934 length:1248 start_codon:yes stop_codon:yes gene_type:complete
MHILKEIRSNLDFYKKKLKDRDPKINLNALIDLDKKNRELIQKKEKFEQEKKILSKTKNEKNFKKSKEISEKLSILISKQNDIKTKIDDILSNLPNIALNDVPIGKDENFNKVIRKHGEIKKFNFKIKSHVEIGEDKNEMDFEASRKLSGSRFVVLKNNLALLERALINFMLDIHTINFNYSEVSPPLIVNEEVMYGTGQLPKFENDQFEIKTEDKNERKFLIPTAEVSLTNLIRNSSFTEKELPKRFVASTPCFRKEAGSYGKDTKGLMRQHQFYKVELVSVVNKKNSINELDRMTNCAEEILKLLKIPYQIKILSTGDMGFSAEKTYDIEAWMPYENKYREISSCSSCGSFQVNRMKVKCNGANGNISISTLNGSGLAVGRLMIAFLENNQNEDGSVTIPEILKKYMNNLKKI